jgi:hypothetical protein
LYGKKFRAAWPQGRAVRPPTRYVPRVHSMARSGCGRAARRRGRCSLVAPHRWIAQLAARIFSKETGACMTNRCVFANAITHRTWTLYPLDLTYGNISAGATPDGNLDARTMHDGDALSPVTCLVCLHRLMESFRDNLNFS